MTLACSLLGKIFPLLAASIYLAKGKITRGRDFLTFCPKFFKKRKNHLIACKIVKYEKQPLKMRNKIAVAKGTCKRTHFIVAFS